MFEKELVIDGKNHLFGKLAAAVAKQLLCGQKVVIVRAECVVQSGLQFRKQTEYAEFVEKQSNSNPRKGGPHHYKSPARLLWRCIKSMLPRKTERGAKALERVKVFEGMPYPYSHVKKNVVPSALRLLNLKKGRKFTVMGEFCEKIGYNKLAVVKKLEAAREEKAHSYFEKKVKVLEKIKEEANKLSDVQKLRTELAQYGY